MKTADRWSQVLLKLKREHYNQQNQPKHCFKRKRIRFASIAPEHHSSVGRFRVNQSHFEGGRTLLSSVSQCSGCSSAVLWRRRANCPAGGPFCVTWHAREITGAKLYQKNSMNQSMRCWPGGKLKRGQKKTPKETTSKLSSGKSDCCKSNVIDLKGNTSVRLTRDLRPFILLKPQKHVLKFWFDMIACIPEKAAEVNARADSQTDVTWLRIGGVTYEAASNARLSAPSVGGNSLSGACEFEKRSLAPRYTLQLNSSPRRAVGKMNSFRKRQTLGRGWLASGGADVHVWISEGNSSRDFGVNGQMWDSRGWSILIQAVDVEDQSCRLFLVPHFRLL